MSMSKDALRSRILRNVRDGAYIPTTFRHGFSESVSVSPSGRTAVVGAAQPLSTNLGDLFSRALARR
jgi:hypothetical protein